MIFVRHETPMGPRWHKADFDTGVAVCGWEVPIMVLTFTQSQAVLAENYPPTAACPDCFAAELKDGGWPA